MKEKDKIIDLGILPESEFSGVKEIALVEEPAIELDFLYFNKEEFDFPKDTCWKGYEPVGLKPGRGGRQVPNCVPVEAEKFVRPNAGEEESEFISRCISYMKGEGKDDDTAAAICYSYWDEAFDIDTAGLEPYVDPGIPKKRIEELFSEESLDILLELAAQLGVSGDDVELVEKFSKNPKEADYTPARTITKEDGVEILYKYTSSRVASNSRTFCTRLMALNRYYSREEIDALDTFNEEFGPGAGGGKYSIFKYKGGTNCQHYWQKYEAQRVGGRLQVTPAATDNNIQRTAATAPRATTGRGYVKRPQRSLAPLPGHTGFQKVSDLAFNFADDEKQIVVGPAMIPGMIIPRKHDDGSRYEVRFSEETIREIAMKYMKEARTNMTNNDHETGKRAGAYVFESWIVEDPETDKAKTIYGYDVPKGTWMIAMKVDDKKTWKRIKAGELKGFSVEGAFSDMEEIEARKKYQELIRILKD